MDKSEVAARLTVIERAIVDLAALAAQLRIDLLDEEPSHVLGSSHDRT